MAAGDGIGSTPRNTALTISHWVSGVSDQAYDHFPLLGLIKKMGGVKRISGGGEIRWMFSAGYPALETMTMTPGTFQPTGNMHNASVPWASYVLREVVFPGEKAENAGSAAKGPLVSTVLERLQNSVPQRLADQFYLDGVLSANANRLMGLESFMAITGGSQTAADEAATVLADTYAGKSTVYGSVAGIAGATQATQTLGAKAWSPAIVSTNLTPSGGSQLSWENNAEIFLGRVVRKATWGASMQDSPTIAVLTETAYAQLLDRYRNTHRVVLGESYLTTKYGFKPIGVFNAEGVAVHWDRALPATDASSDAVQGYVLNPHKMKLYLQDSGVSNTTKGKGEADLFEFWQGQEDRTLADEYALVSRMQLAFESPRFFGKLAAIA